MSDSKRTSAMTQAWSNLMDDLENTADEYRERGWDVLPIHAGDVVTLPDRVAIDVLAPGDEFETLQEMIGDFDPDNFSVYTGGSDTATFALVIAEDEDCSSAVCCPVFVMGPDVSELRNSSKQAGFVQIQIRPLSDDDSVVFRIDEPELLFQ